MTDRAARATAQTLAPSTVIVLTFLPLQLMERVESQINKINIVSATCVHRFGTALRCY